MEVSSMTAYDKITISANFYSIASNKFQCSSQVSKLAERIGYDKAKERISITNGCGNLAEKHRYEIDGIRYHKCLCDYLNPYMGFLLEIHNQYDKGVMPFPGSLSEQPAKIIEILNRISAIKSDYLEYNTKEQEKNGRHNN